jgi:hypothetical protein
MKYFLVLFLVSLSCCSFSEDISEFLIDDDLQAIQEFKDANMRPQVFEKVYDIFALGGLRKKKMFFKDVIGILGEPDSLVRHDEPDSFELIYLVNTIENDFLQFSFQKNLLTGVSIGRIVR